jgi:PAS domain S-box-containing protein
MTAEKRMPEPAGRDAAVARATTTNASVDLPADIDEQATAAPSLRELKAIRDVAEQVAGVGSWTWDMATGKVVWSPGMFLLWDVHPDDFDGDVMPILTQRVHPDDLPSLLETTASVLRTGKPEPVEFRLVRRDGTERIVASKATPNRDAGGNVVTMTGYYQDITESKLVEGRLAAAAEQWRQTFDAMSDSVALFDQEARVLRCNVATTVLTGRSFNDIVGRPCYEVFHNATAFHPACPRERAFESGQPETSVMEQDGHWLRVTFQPLTDEEGRVNGGVHVVTDVSELKHAEQGLRESLASQQTLTEGVIAALARTVEVRDPYTAGHQRRVSELGAAMALRMELGEECAEGVRVAGMLHDVGKITIPAEILSKPGRLTEMEFQLIKGHSQSSFDILETIHFPWQVAEMALQHHERQDGSGYPEGLSGDAILPEARILAVADVVEAMASHRPYRAALGIEVALDEVRSGAGTRYEAVAVEACERVFEDGFAFTES